LLIALPLLLAAMSDFHPLQGCSLFRPIEFFDDLNALPREVRSDFTKRIGIIHARSEKVDFSDTPNLTAKTGNQLLYVGRAKNQWLISYVYGGFVIRDVTVSYLYDESVPKSQPLLMGALQGNGCTAANAFLQGAAVEPGWQR
jgi:hypothetical protein